MKTVISKDGTTIAYDQSGKGNPIILVGGAFSYRKFGGLVEMSNLLAEHFTVINYDRRGRGDSGDTKPYAIEREIEDIDALITAVGGSAYVWGTSSGAVLALRAAAHGLNITKLVVYEPPFNVDDSSPLPPPDFVKHITELIALDRRDESVKYFMKTVGAPAIFVKLMPFIMRGVWKNLKAVAHTLPYDVMLVGDNIVGKPLSPHPWTSITVPTLVVNGDKSAPSLQNTARAMANILPNAQHQVLVGQTHNVSMKVFAPLVKEFLI